MKTVTIHPPVEVFPDPEFCNGINIRCGYLNDPTVIWKYECGLFITPVDELNENAYRVVKCQQCKDLYEEVKFKESCKTPNHIV